MNPSNDDKDAYQAELLYNRLKKRGRHLSKWAKRTGTEAYRLYDRDIPEIPLTLDVYKDAVVGSLYQRPYEKEAERETIWLSCMAEAVEKALEIPQSSIFLKERRKMSHHGLSEGLKSAQNQYERLSNQGISKNVSEGGLLFRVNLSDYLDTGLFPDRRLLRNRLRGEIQGKTLLNLFCYTGSFSVYAAAGGAREIDSVDISASYLDWGAANFALNGLTAERVDPWALRNHSGLPPFRLIRADVIRFIDEALIARRSWDTIILDPPIFSNSKKMSGTFDLNRDHRELIKNCLGLLHPQGTLYFSAPAKRFRLDPEIASPQARVIDITEQLRDEDFRGKRIPQTYRISKTRE